MGIPRLARLLIFSTLLITIPTLYLLYPHRETILQTTQGYLEKGGIDSSHWRDPLPPPPGIDHEAEKLEHEEVRDWEGQDVLTEPEKVLDEVIPPIEESRLSEGSELGIGKDVLEGGVIMPKLENATAKSVTQPCISM
jgi:FAD-linked sulfhydryl oxidase